MDTTYIPMARGFVARHGKPDIFNTYQGSQFTGSAFTGVLATNGIAISMDGKAAWRDNVFIERMWRSVKYEEVHLRAYESVSEASTSIGRYLDFYNGRRPHSGVMCANGQGIAKDEGAAVVWFTNAAEQGYASAQRNLGVMYQEGLGVTRDYGQAFTWFRKAAEQGNPTAQSSLGWLYESGQGTAQDYAQAIA